MIKTNKTEIYNYKITIDLDTDYPIGHSELEEIINEIISESELPNNIAIGWTVQSSIGEKQK